MVAAGYTGTRNEMAFSVGLGVRAGSRRWTATTGGRGNSGLAEDLRLVIGTATLCSGFEFDNRPRSTPSVSFLDDWRSRRRWAAATHGRGACTLWER